VRDRLALGLVSHAAEFAVAQLGPPRRHADFPQCLLGALPFGTLPVLTASLGRLQSRLARDSRIGYPVEAEALEGQRGLRPAELSEAWGSYPKDDPSAAHLGGRQWSNRGSC
jgi:hypothetical protein